MVAKRHDLGFGFALWHTPYVGEDQEATAALHAEAEERGYYPTRHGIVGNNWGRLVDLTNPAAYAWWPPLIRQTGRSPRPRSPQRPPAPRRTCSPDAAASPRPSRSQSGRPHDSTTGRGPVPVNIRQAAGGGVGRVGGGGGFRNCSHSHGRRLSKA